MGQQHQCHPASVGLAPGRKPLAAFLRDWFKPAAFGRCIGKEEDRFKGSYYQ
jgi:hypothetical protein